MINFIALVPLENWKFGHAEAIVAIQSLTFGVQPTMQYSSKPKAFTIIRNQNQRTALNIDELLDPEEGAVG